ncbi:putative transcription factor GRAS family [Helianthus annuus]|nr:putative transcription factor GRAS family [Helianthus annuus]KAJ0777831.1 putative transcription factor GRAS family [Helianthus annuus]KAJ0786844.1 putative transcription factor GRAS family [Helianthus annuus]KAJ0952431.1 putative transcription factor GRAS family [Helianthus annuus]
MEKPNEICNYSKGDVTDDSKNKSCQILFSTEHDQVEHEPLKSFQQFDALFQDTTLPFGSYEHKMQELVDIESQYSELLKPRVRSHDRVASSDESGRKLSTDEIIRLGGERFIQSRSSSSTNDLWISTHPYVDSFSGLSDPELKDVQLIETFLLSSEKVTQQQFERSSKLLDWCDMLSSSLGNPIQRVIYYFSKALREKIDKETRRISLFNGPAEKHAYDMEERIMNTTTNLVAIYQKLPFYQAGHFSGVQALLDQVSRSRRVHVIDLAIRHGVQIMILMKALASQHDFPIKHLKVTAVGTGFEEKIKQTGDRLKSFSESMDLSFSFNIVIVEDMLDFNKELLDLDPREAVGVYSAHALWSLIAQQDRLESLMKVIKSIKPRVMVVCEVAANLNSPNFVNRLIEALFYYGAVFDSLEECMDREDENRSEIESMYQGEAIRSIVAADGAKRAIRHVNMDVWRKFFARFGMKEIGLSMSTLYQAKLVAGKFSCGNSCTLDMDGFGKSVIIGWKGTPIVCLSAWEFS